jgi:outer membrane lipoprotein-sorting protein
MKSYYLDPGRYRNEFDDTVTVVDYQARKAVTTLPKLKQAVVLNLKLADDQKEEPLDAFGKLRQLLDVRGADDKQYELLGVKEIDGRNTIGFRHETPLGSITMWGDPQSGMPVLVTTVWNGLPPTTATMRDFQLDVELKPDLFDLAIPEGYKVQTLDADASKTTEADLVIALRALSEVDGVFPDALDTQSVTKALTKLFVNKTREAAKENQEVDPTPRLMTLSMTIGRGAMFATQLPASADAHYAGKGVKRDEPERPIFWYKREGGQIYRVIYADLSVTESSDPPQVAGAQPVGGLATERKKQEAK